MCVVVNDALAQGFVFVKIMREFSNQEQPDKIAYCKFLLV